MSQSTNLQNRLIEALQKKYPRSRLFRQNNGNAYPITTFRRALPFLQRGETPVWFRPVKYGVEGQGDIGGWINVDGVAVAAHVEIKIDKDRQRDTQEVFESTITKCGGIYVLAHTLEEGMDGVAREVERVRDLALKLRH